MTTHPNGNKLIKNGIKCCKCDKILGNVLSYERHLRGHDNNTCNYCSETFSESKSLKKHLRVHHQIQTKFQCEFCEKKFAKQVALNTHVHKLHSNGEFCDGCKITCVSHVELELHVEFCKPFKCHLCALRFKQQHLLDRHLKKHDKYTCKVCSTKLNGNDAYKKHLLDCVGHVDKFTCAVCGEAFLLRGTLENHTKSHKVLPCTMCNFVADRTLALKQHERKFHAKNKKHQCEMCGKRYATTFRLNEHQKTHGNNQIKCLQCNANFQRKSELRRHEKSVHANERPFVCEYCAISYKQRNHLDRHVKSKHALTNATDEIKQTENNMNVELNELAMNPNEFVTNEFSTNGFDEYSPNRFGEYRQMDLVVYEIGQLIDSDLIGDASDSIDQINYSMGDSASSFVQLDHIDSKDLIVLSDQITSEQITDQIVEIAGDARLDEYLDTCSDLSKYLDLGGF